MWKIVGASGALALTLSGCGGGGGTTPAPGPPGPPGPPGASGNHTEACKAPQLRAQCTGTCTRNYDKTPNVVYCKECAAPYKINLATLNCEVKCSDLPAPSPSPSIPKTATDLRGVDWPSACFDDEDEVTFFSIGDWGGICGWPNYDHDDPTLDLCAHPGPPGKRYRPGWGIPAGQGIMDGMPFPMDTYKRATYVDLNAQVLIADKMAAKYDELKAAGQPPRFVINVGDSIYPGGIEEHCSNKGAGDIDAIAKMYQWTAVFEKIYKSSDETYNKLEWMGVLGNHDYGGNCYVKAWDQLIFYTWTQDSRWRIPAQYWKRTMQFKRFAAEFYFIDGNINDVSPADNDPKHNICFRHGNDDSVWPPGSDARHDQDHCHYKDYPPSQGAGAACPKTGGPSSPDDCVGWFTKLWKDNLDWLTKGLESSTAQWQIVVSHYPVMYARNMAWPAYAKKHGIDLIITGHQHRQDIYNEKPIEKRYDGSQTDMGPTVHVVTGGGGGIQTDAPPNPDGADDAYGYMIMKMQVNQLTVEAWTHGGKLLKNGGKHVLRNSTVAPPVLKGGAKLVV